MRHAFDFNDCDIANSRNLDAIINKLQESTDNLFQWFGYNHMKANSGKCYILVTGSYEASVNIIECEIKRNKIKKLIGISFDIRLSFEQHVTKICNIITIKIVLL